MKILHIELNPGDEFRVTFNGLWPSCDVNIKYTDDERMVRVGQGDSKPATVAKLDLRRPKPRAIA